MIRKELMNAHRALVKVYMIAARMIYQLLRTGNLTMGLDDASWEVENLLLNLGVRVTYNPTCTMAYAKLSTRKGFFR